MHLTETFAIETLIKPDTHAGRLERRQKRDRLDRPRARDQRARDRRGTRAEWLAEAHEDRAFTAAG